MIKSLVFLFFGIFMPFAFVAATEVVRYFFRKNKDDFVFYINLTIHDIVYYVFGGICFYLISIQ